MNALTAPSDILAGAAPKWQARDDVYQVGPAAGMLVKGDARARIRTAGGPRAAVQRSPEGDRLPLHRRAAEALRERRRADRRRCGTRRRALKAGVLRTLKGVHLAFTGILSRPRSEAMRAAKRAGAIVHGGPSAQDDRRRARPAQPAAGRRPRRRPEADGDQAAAREGPPHHAPQRSAVLAAGRDAQLRPPSREGRAPTSRMTRRRPATP